MRVTKQISIHGVYFMPKRIIMQYSLRLCSFCNFCHGKVSKLMPHQININTTTVNRLSLFTIKRKVKQGTKQCAELLKVSTQDKLHKIEDSTLSTIFNSEYVTSNDCHVSCKNEIDLNKESRIDTSSNKHRGHEKKVYNDEISTQDLEKIGENKKVKKKLEQSIVYETSMEGEKKNKKSEKYCTKTYIDNLLVHMQVYLNCGLLNTTNRTLMRYRKCIQNKTKDNQCVQIYNILLEAYASRGNLIKVLDVYNMIKEDSLIPTAQTYAYIFDALGKNEKNDEQTALLNELKSELNINNISFNDIVNKSNLEVNQRKNVLKVIRLLNPEFEPLCNELNTKYIQKLVTKIPMENNYESPVKGLLTIEELKNSFKLQLHSELVVETEIKNISYCDKTTEVVSNCKNKVIEMEKYWREVALSTFDRNLMCLKEKECQSRALLLLYPFLEVLDKKYYIDAIMREIRQVAQGSETYSATLKVLCHDLGHYIYKQYEIKMKQQTGSVDKINSVYQKYLEWYLNPENMSQFNNMNNRTVWEHFEKEEGIFDTSLSTECLRWPAIVLSNIGRFLYDIILNNITIIPDIYKGNVLKSVIPAFYTLFRNKGNYLAEQIKPHPFISKVYKESQVEMLTFNTHHIPSQCPPRPWTSMNNGGYLITKTDLIRTPIYTNSTLQKLQNTPVQQIYPVLDSLNQLGSIPWEINCAILDIVIEIFKNGGSEKLNIPQSGSGLSCPPTLNKSATSEEKRNAAIAMAKYKQKKFDMYSLWCDALYKLSLANHFRNTTFWLPHTLDFRGRVYPIPPHLNHLQSDMARSLLLFAKAKPLGTNGLDWLKVHVINLTSFKKRSSIKDRLEYANENMEDILDSAVKPLTGKMWWTKSEAPWQTLAGCMEIANALKATNVEKYESKYPVHQDGSCNGLQHYAALGRDKSGAENVNLCPFDTPRDVYFAVASLVEKQRHDDAKKDIKIAQVLNGFVKRKVIKQTVMTTVYGVTKFGAKLQIVKQLKSIEDFPVEYIWPASLYLTQTTFHTLRSMFKSAREIQDWFTTCARIISSICNESVEWITPLGLPVVQPYIRDRKFSNNAVPDAVKQKNAFAPNFIHSLDSTHMMLTGLHCSQAGITFVSVHDCFWTHACSVEILNKICREQFVALHTEPLLENLAKYFIHRYKPIYEKLPRRNTELEKVSELLSNVPAKGTLDINNVLSSTYFFS